MVKNGKFGCCRCVLHHFRMRYDLYIKFQQNVNVHHFSLFFSGFSYFDGRNFDEEFFGMSSWQSFGQNMTISLPEKNVAIRMHYFFPTLIFVIFAQISKSHLWVKSGEEFLRGVLTDRKVLASKSMESHLSNALSNAFIAFLVAEISSFQFQKFHSTHLWAAFSY